MNIYFIVYGVGVILSFFFCGAIKVHKLIGFDTENSDILFLVFILVILCSGWPVFICIYILFNLYKLGVKLFGG